MTDASPDPSLRPISADSHIVEGPDVFVGLAERFGALARDPTDAELMMFAQVKAACRGRLPRSHGRQGYGSQHLLVFLLLSSSAG